MICRHQNKSNVLLKANVYFSRHGHDVNVAIRTAHWSSWDFVAKWDMKTELCGLTNQMV